MNQRNDKADNQANNHYPNDNPKPFTRNDLIEQLQAYIDNFEKLPEHEKFSPALMVDVYYPLLIILNILVIGEE
jgi:hypothetical protein